jgi:gliding motility-associated lipoprotein GldH
LISQGDAEINVEVVAPGKKQGLKRTRVTIRRKAVPAEEAETRVETGTETETRMRNVLLVLAALLMLASCDSKMLVGEMHELPGSWGKNEVMTFEIPRLDSLKKYNMFLHLRNTHDYPFNNIFLIASMEFPHGLTITDTLEYRMANPDGSWLGTGIGPVKESKLVYKENVSFIEEGIYILSVSHAVRNNGEVQGVSHLDGITEVGYSIEEAIK